MPKVLLVDTNFSSVPIYDFLGQSGYEVYACGNNPNDCIAKFAPNFFCIDYSDHQSLQELISSLNIDYVIPGCNDLSYKSCAVINSHNNFYAIDSVTATDTLNNKKEFRAFASDISLSVPKSFSDLQDVFSQGIWPVIIKPTDAYSGRGTSIVFEEDVCRLENAIEQAKLFSRSNSYVIEEFVTGQLFSHSAFVGGGRIVQDFIVEEHGTANSFVVDTSRVIYDFPNNVLEKIRDSVLWMVNSLNLVDGLIHTQFIKNDEQFWLIEVTRRCPGDLYSQLIELSTSFPYVEAYVRPFLNSKLELNEFNINEKFVMRHTISQTTDCPVNSVQFKIPIQIENLVPLSLAGDMVKASPFGRVGILFAKTQSSSELNSLFEATLKRNLYNLL